MPLFTCEHQIDMLLVYGEVRKNRREAKALYGQRYPDRAQPRDKYFPWLERHLKTERIEEEPNEFIVSEEAEINTLACIEVDPTTSVRQIAANIGIGRESVRNILKKHEFKPFKYQVHHHFYEAGHQRRLEFCNWFMVQQRPNLSRFIHFSDESRFTNLGMFNKNNSRYWARENPHLFRQGAFQERFGVNVWMGVIGTRIVGPIFFENPLTADHRSVQLRAARSVSNMQRIRLVEESGKGFRFRPGAEYLWSEINTNDPY
ncbi:hypothetical protein NQ318_011606 [Aromia moschata]|uniref:DUF4817 domain-containing protein n=1 Tax=Aromia moschata TaxID=1265417 RepID=A0AAV8Z7I9_9CUCU|nr:hypothetical protein NQ318_011606 [Aromia moschata]